MARAGDKRDEGANTERASPAGLAESRPHSGASPSGEKSRNLQPVSDAEEEDPEAPPWNFLFELPVALLVLVAIVGLVIAFSR